MPRSSNAQGDLSHLSNTNPVADKDNVYFSSHGWVQRHYTNAAKTTYWDEILVAGQALLANGNNDATADQFTYTAEGSGGGSTPPTSPTFLTGDTTQAPPAAGKVLRAYIVTAGEGYVAETTATQASTDGSGAGVTFDITVDGGGVATVVVTAGGTGYVDGEVVTLTGGTTGATVRVVAA